MKMTIKSDFKIIVRGNKIFYDGKRIYRDGSIEFVTVYLDDVKNQDNSKLYK